MDNEIVSLPVKEKERAIAQTQGKPTDHKTDSNNESMDEELCVTESNTPSPLPRIVLLVQIRTFRAIEMRTGPPQWR